MLRNFTTKLPVLRYLGICNVFRIILWSVRAIPTYRVYRLYDMTHVFKYMALIYKSGAYLSKSDILYQAHYYINQADT